MAGRIHEIEDIGLAVFGFVREPHRLRFDRDAALALDIHRVEDLLHHVALGQSAGFLDQTIRKRRFAVVDMGNNGKIANLVKGVRAHAHASSSMPAFFQAGEASDAASGLVITDFKRFSRASFSTVQIGEVPCSTILGLGRMRRGGLETVLDTDHINKANCVGLNSFSRRPVERHFPCGLECRSALASGSVVGGHGHCFYGGGDFDPLHILFWLAAA